MKKVTAMLTVQNKKYTYTLTEKKAGEVHVVCEAARIDQDFLAEDVPTLLIDLPNLILAERSEQAKQSAVLRFRVSPKDKLKIEKNALEAGFNSVSDYLRAIATV